MGTNLSHLGDFPTLGGISVCTSAPHLPPFALSDSSTGYNIRNLLFMDSVHLVGLKSPQMLVLRGPTAPPSGTFLPLGPFISAPPEPPFAPSNPSTGYNI